MNMAENLPEGFSLNIGSKIGPKESPNDTFLRTATSPTFPFLQFKIVLDKDIIEKSLEIKVSKEIYDFLKGTAQTDNVIFYLNNITGTFNQWNYDMVIPMNVLAKLEIFVDMDTWISESRESLVKLLKNEKVEASFESKNALQNSKELLKSLEILDEVEKSNLIFSTVDEIIKEKIMDAGTMIYRLAMAIYHSNRDTGKSIVSALDDPSSLYLKLPKSDVYNKWKSQFSEMMNLPLESRVKAMKVLTTFTISAYAYYKTVKGES